MPNDLKNHLAFASNNFIQSRNKNIDQTNHDNDDEDELLVDHHSPNPTIIRQISSLTNHKNLLDNIHDELLFSPASNDGVNFTNFTNSETTQPQFSGQNDRNILINLKKSKNEFLNYAFDSNSTSSLVNASFSLPDHFLNQPSYINFNNNKENKKNDRLEIDGLVKNTPAFHANSNNNNRIIKCICKNSYEKSFQCLACTSHFPITVCRSKDGEETQPYTIHTVAQQQKILDNSNHKKVKLLNDRKEFEAKFSRHSFIDNKNDNKNAQTRFIMSGGGESPSSNESSLSSLSNCSQNSDANLATNSVPPHIILKPSPIPVSSTLIDLLTLTNPAYKFRSPPNRNIAHFQNDSTQFIKNNTSNK